MSDGELSREGCEYCLSGAPMVRPGPCDDPAWGVSARLCPEKREHRGMAMAVAYRADGLVTASHYVRVRYCPMCGRDLRACP